MRLLHNYKVFSEDNIKKIFELSPSIEEKFYIEKKSKLRYGIIKNFYKDPEAVAAFYQNYPLIEPSEIRSEFYDRSVHSNSPGIQSYCNMDLGKSLRHIYMYLHSTLKKGGFPHRSKLTSEEKVKNNMQVGSEFDLVYWDSYNNFYWKGMNATAASQVPHFDTFNLGFNIWLSKDVPDGTDFFTYRFKNHDPVFYVQQFIERNSDNVELIEEFFTHYNNDTEQEMPVQDTAMIQFEPRFSKNGIWNQEENTSEEWDKWFTIPAEYNTCTFYPGLYFHRPNISQNFPEDLLRFSQVITHSWMSPEKFQEGYHKWSNSEQFMGGASNPKRMMFVGDGPDVRPKWS